MSRDRVFLPGLRGLLLGAVLSASAPARAQELTVLPGRDGTLSWLAPSYSHLALTVSFRDALDAEIRHRLTRGLPTTVVLVAALYRAGGETPIATTLQSCKATWHVWEEAYRVELTQPGTVALFDWTTTMEGVLRRCAETRRLLIASRAQVPPKAALFVKARVEINPIGDELMKKLKAWVTQPSGSTAGAPGDALFGAFTGIFMQRIGKAERLLSFVTRPKVPVSEPKATSPRP